MSANLKPIKATNCDGSPMRSKRRGKTVSETANKITSNILRVINMQPQCVAYRVNNTGIYDDKIGGFRKAHTQKGIPDIFACIRGVFVTFEVKAGKDRQSIHQKATEFEINKAGGKYIVVRSTDDFLSFFSAFIQQNRVQ